VTDQAPMLASKYRIDLMEAKSILLEFHKARRTPTGGIEYSDFKQLCCNVFDDRSANEDIIEKIYRETEMESNATVDKFCQWYMMNLFSTAAMLSASPEKGASDRLVARIASDFNLPPNQLDNIKREFDKFDKDNSGYIDREEFDSVLRTMLKAKDSCDLSSERLTKFWKEIDADGNGQVDFTEFTHWYLKYFTPEGTFEAGSCNLIEAFYASYNPNNQRRWQISRAEGFE